MNHHHENACESVDAAVFTGEILEVDLEAFKGYLGRWNRAVGNLDADLTARVRRLESLLREWDEPGACGCDTATCTGLCLPARTRNALNP